MFALFVVDYAVAIFLQSPASGEDVVSQIGDRSDPEFEKEFLSNSSEGVNEDVEAVFKELF